MFIEYDKVIKPISRDINRKYNIIDLIISVHV